LAHQLLAHSDNSPTFFCKFVEPLYVDVELSLVGSILAAVVLNDGA
jgi:hypothetical protein